MNEPNQQTVSAEIPPPVALVQMLTGYWVSQALYVAPNSALLTC